MWPVRDPISPQCPWMVSVVTTWSTQRMSVGFITSSGIAGGGCGLREGLSLPMTTVITVLTELGLRLKLSLLYRECSGAVARRRRTLATLMGKIFGETWTGRLQVSPWR